MSTISFSIKAVILLCCGLIAAKVPALAENLAGSRPNIVLVMTDDQGYGPIGRHGHPWIGTPNLDSLHDTSTRFTRFHVSPQRVLPLARR